MFIKLKKAIQIIAKQAVYLAEKTLGGGDGYIKKQMALEYIISNMPVCVPFKRLVARLLAKFIDETIEFAVSNLKSFPSGSEQ